VKKQIKELAYLSIVAILFFLLFIPVIYFVETSVEKKVEALYSNSIVKYSLIKSEVVKLEDFITEEFSLLILFYVLLVGLVYSIFLIKIKKIKQDLLDKYDKLIEELRHKHYYDNLTELPNRNKLIEDLDKYSGMILMDIDDFSDINDVFGYKFGNRLLKELALELKKDFSNSNLYRAGNDEFVIAYDRKIDKNDLRKIYEKEFVFEDIKITFTISGSNQKGLLLKTAESALKIAKKNNLNCLLFDKSIEDNQIKRIKTIQELKKVLDKEKIIPFYQCIKGKENKYEALMRVEINGKILTPFAFMDLFY
jgi:diguanylate cyclase (GGDEF)-like protein